MRKCLILISLLFATDSFSQLKISDLPRFHIGYDSLSSRKEVAKLFSVRGNLFKSQTYSSVYDHVFENTTFNYCENATCKFIYVNDKLFNLSFDLSYSINQEKYEALNYLKSIETLLSALAEKNYLFKFQPKYSNAINLKKINSIIDSSSFYLKTKTKSNERFEFKYSGENVYTPESDKDLRILILNTSIAKENNDDKSTKQLFLNISIQLTRRDYYQDYFKYSTGGSKLVKDNTEIDLVFENGVYKLPVNLNGVMSLDFILDLGASDVSLSPDVFLVLYRAGTISESDFIGTSTYRFADGSTAKSDVFNLKSLRIGDFQLKDVRASISNNINSPLLLGQSALKKLPSYRIDNQNNKLIVE
jgi:hypothetical protein